MPSKPISFKKLLKDKEQFLLSTYSLLIVELIITFAIVYAFRNNATAKKITKQSTITYFVLTLGLILILSFVPMPPVLKIIVFTAFAIVIGGMLHSTTAYIPKELVDNALKGAVLVFISMTFLAFILASAGVDLSWMAGILFAALIGLIIATLLKIIFWPNAKTFQFALLAIGLALFSVFVLTYTNMMLQPSYKEDYITAAIGFYLDFINIFNSILGLEST